MKRKRRTVTIGDKPLEAGHRQARERRLRGLAAAVARYERDHGVITDDELLTQQRADERAAIVVGGRGPLSARSRGGRHKTIKRRVPALT